MLPRQTRHQFIRPWVALCVGLLTATLEQSASAEGTASLGNTQALRANTQLYVDIVDASQESIVWVGAGSVRVVDPVGNNLGDFASGEIVLPSGGAGPYGVKVLSDQAVGREWGVEVLDPVTAGGRLHSREWRFNAGAFSDDRATDASFYARVDGGDGKTSVIELKLDGLAGYVYEISANRRGVLGANGGRSVDEDGNSLELEYPVYLSPPTLADYDAVVPDVANFGFDGGVDQDVFGDPLDPCQQVAPGTSTGYFLFETEIEGGSYHIQCDLNADGVFDRSDPADLLLTGATVAGVNTVPWAGIHDGDLVATGDYQCQVQLNTGEFHYVGRDIETSYPGMRMFEVAADGSRVGLRMFWNDSEVQDRALTMLNGAKGSETSGLEGIFSGAYTDPVVPNENSRSWGRFIGDGKGNRSYIDTYVFLEAETSTTITVRAVDPTIDGDGDGLSDFEELCFVGSDPASPDTDEDGVPDGVQYEALSSPAEHAGLESNGRLSTQLAGRAIRRAYLSEMVPEDLVLRAQSLVLHNLLPPVVAGASEVEIAANQELVDITNAEGVVGADYVNESGERVGSALLVATFGEHYEHSKQLCDRAGGGRIHSLRAPAGLGYPLLMVEFENPREREREHAAVFKVYQKGSESLRLASSWLPEQYPEVAEQERVIEVQLWAREAQTLDEMVDSFLASAASQYGLILHEQLEGSHDDRVLSGGEYLPPTTPRRERADAPAAYFSSGRLLGHTLTFDLRQFEPVPDPSLRVIGIDPETLDERRVPLEFRPGSGSQSYQLPLLLDLELELVSGSEVLDRMWLSDGAWAPFEDTIWGGTSKVHDFSRETCSIAPARGDLDLSGCARIEAEVVDFAGVARYLAQPLDLRAYEAMVFRLESNRESLVCLHALDRGTRACTTIEPSRGGEPTFIQLSQLVAGEGELRDTLEQAQLLTVTTESAGATRLEVSSVGFLETFEASSESGCGCAMQAGGRVNPSWWLVLSIGLCRLILATLWRRPRTCRGA